MALTVIYSLAIAIVLTVAIIWGGGRLDLWSQRRRLQREGRIIQWDQAIEFVRRGAGYLIAASDGYRVNELWYADGPAPEDSFAIWNTRSRHALLIEDAPPKADGAEFDSLRKVRKCVDLNLNDLYLD